MRPLGAGARQTGGWGARGAGGWGARAVGQAPVRRVRAARASPQARPWRRRPLSPPSLPAGPRGGGQANARPFPF